MGDEPARHPLITNGLQVQILPGSQHITLIIPDYLRDNPLCLLTTLTLLGSLGLE